MVLQSAIYTHKFLAKLRTLFIRELKPTISKDLELKFFNEVSSKAQIIESLTSSQTLHGLITHKNLVSK